MNDNSVCWRTFSQKETIHNITIKNVLTADQVTSSDCYDTNYFSTTQITFRRHEMWSDSRSEIRQATKITRETETSDDMTRRFGGEEMRITCSDLTPYIGCDRGLGFLSQSYACDERNNIFFTCCFSLFCRGEEGSETSTCPYGLSLCTTIQPW